MFKTFQFSVIFISFIILFCSCKKEPNCHNGGVVVNGECECKGGFQGDLCSEVDTSNLQVLLNAGFTPIELLNRGVLPHQLYGRNYLDGIIFHLDSEGNGMLAWPTDLGSDIEWGCYNLDISSLEDITECAEDCFYPEPEETMEGAKIGDGFQNTDIILENCTEENIAARKCRNLGPAWFLPSRGELYLMYENLHSKGKGNFNYYGINSGWYWTSTERNNDAWFISFNSCIKSVHSKNGKLYLRAARYF